MIEVVWFIGGYITQLIGSFLLLSRIWQRQSIYGLSIDTQICYLLSTFARCLWSFDTRLIETRIAHLELFCAMSVAVGNCLLCLKFRRTTTKRPLWLYSAKLLVPAALVLALVFHPGRAIVSLQVLVAFTMYLEAMALLPQLDLMRKFEEVEPLTSHYIALIVLSRLIRLLFWGSLYLQGDKFVGLLLADIIHTAFCAQYMFIWVSRFRNVKSGGVLLHEL
eukprot:Gregarina_sp_Pseudo_9__5322@NODE_625_length_2471_cov_78_035362_g589_i0_p2_GENE_NODE_625_length_2471_cov_78_035362_g589_i0NODE_625_length_2471_cov_78_035362_g589_i0_p2_ORF_typecomplete_len221_score50_66ER_lumen_recept/PF00810_18/4_9e25ER_lumen_recept/PF00810_18/1_8e04PQloop/PF04193_14/0_056PQloop/PF04193_14/7_1e02PQloop/PF04193_14/4_1e03DUF1118/PF06549_12/0_14_NODE_625_length_2471_cov_78_035362_g589_i017152377